MAAESLAEIFEKQGQAWQGVIARAQQKPGVDLLEDAANEVRRRSLVHGDNDYSAVSASEERSDPGGGVGAPEHDAVAFANLAGCQFTGETVSGVGDVAIAGADYAISVRLGEGGFPAQPREIRQVVGDA
jgi:hypothetical protein